MVMEPTSLRRVQRTVSDPERTLSDGRYASAWWTSLGINTFPFHIAGSRRRTLVRWSIGNHKAGGSVQGDGGTIVLIHVQTNTIDGCPAEQLIQELSAVSTTAMDWTHDEFGQMLPLLWFIEYLSERNDGSADYHHVRILLRETDGMREGNPIDRKCNLRATPSFAFLRCANP
jgi:hypothetical protein